MERGFEIQPDNTASDGQEHSEAGEGRQELAAPRIKALLGAISRLSGVTIGLLDSSGQPADLTDEGALSPIPGEGKVISASLLAMVVRDPRPILHKGLEGGLGVSVPFLVGGRLAGFVNASCFSLGEIAGEEKSRLKKRFIVGTLKQAPGAEEACPTLDVESFFSLADLLETAAAELTFLETLSEMPRSVISHNGQPLAWMVASFMDEVESEAQDESRLQAALRDRELLEALYNSTQYGILMLDKDMKIVAANKVFGDIFGTQPEAFMGVSAEWLRRWVVKHAADPQRAASILDHLLSNDDAVMDDELELATPRHMILRFFSSPTRNKEGETVGRSFMFRDITEFRQARHEMIGTEKMTAIGRVAAGLAHGLNNILAGVVTYADYALEEGKPDKIRDALKMSISAAEKASELVGKLLVVSGASESRRQDVDLHVELERLLDSMNDDFERANIRVHRLLEPVPHINVDPVQMQEAFRHILDNARDAIVSEGTITVRTATDWDGDSVNVVISDTGPGISQERLDRIFDPFYTTRGVVSGGAETGRSGLGLSLTKGIIEQHGGKISVSNIRPHGAAFIVELPLSGAKKEEKPAPSMY